MQSILINKLSDIECLINKDDDDHVKIFKELDLDVLFNYDFIIETNKKIHHQIPVYDYDRLDIFEKIYVDILSDIEIYSFLDERKNIKNHKIYYTIIILYYELRDFDNILVKDKIDLRSFIIHKQNKYHYVSDEIYDYFYQDLIYNVKDDPLEYIDEITELKYELYNRNKEINELKAKLDCLKNIDNLEKEFYS